MSHLEDRKKCFWCDSRPETGNNPGLNHKVSNIIYRYHPGTRQRSWWQTRNGIENVTIQLDLEAEFHFTHLIIVFKTFRPAAMLVERSFDFGKTWRVYRYFAHNCDEAFPGVPKHSPRILTDVVCESRYSGVAPSFDGEIIFRVLPPNIVVDNPYSQEVQNLLKMTNLRINFTKLHTLGDDLLDNRAEIQEKYYYAITDMTVRGSCSCYGHASRCLPLPGVESKTDMVHGRCECTHNTKGLNCELCEDFFNDLPWKPAIGKTPNACKRCNCNNHAATCHFDAAVYDSTAKVSGGVCDDCQHNTMGTNCEQCKQFYYQDPDLDIQNPEICKPCDCDPRGSLDEAICDPLTDVATNQEAGKCHCKTNIDGRRCDNCKNGFWNFVGNSTDGCEACTCDLFGTVDNRGCDVYTGDCTCKRNVVGRDCNQCRPEYYGLSEDDDGCSACDCDLGGALSNSCDIITGQCPCRTNVQGRRCDQPMQHFFSGALDNLVYEAELARCNSGPDDNAINNNCQPKIREPFRDGREDSWTGAGFMKVFEDDHLEFVVDGISTSMDYDLVIRYEPEMPGDWQQVLVKIDRPDQIDLNSPCANSMPDDDFKSVILTDNSRSAIVDTPVCLEAGKQYNVKIHFISQDPEVANTRASVLIDSIVLVPKVLTLPFFNSTSPMAEANRREYQRARCEDQFYYNIQKSGVPDICKKFHTSVGFYVFNGGLPCSCDATGSTSYTCDGYGGSCPCKKNIVGQRCNRCAPGTYGFGPEGCKACDCNNIGALDNFCELNTGQCKCKPNTYGRQCDECQSGYWNFPSCQQCECHGHADVCDPKTGACTSCRDFTEGHRCDRCEEGYYGDPRLGVDIPCRACPCPGTKESSHSFAARCTLDELTADVVCECEQGYAGSRCDVCADNYFGHPEEPGGSCQACDCNDNTDVTKPGNCDHHTGQCLQCLHNTGGDHCEHCRNDFFGDAFLKTCTICSCEILGTNCSVGFCNRVTGQCPCYKNVIGLQCDECLENHWKIASGEGCDACECDPVGSNSTQCNKFDGQCNCKQGFGGRQCDQCQENYWGDPNSECFPCQCDQLGSNDTQCVRDTGACVCLPGIGGYKCDQCARGFLGESPTCSPCGECFDNWDRIVSGLLVDTDHAINNASKIKTVGATGAYTRDFDEMEKKLKNIQNLVDSTLVGEEEIGHFDEKVNSLKNMLAVSDRNVTRVNAELANATTSINLAKVALENLRENSAKLKEKSIQLEMNATKLQEANLEGALNLTRDAKQRAINAIDAADGTQTTIRDTERQIKGTDLLVERQYDSFNNTQKDNDKNLSELQDALNELESEIPELNDKMCGQASDSCELCGGAGCGTCGGLSCERGALTKADQALDFANKTEIKIRDHESMADDLLRGISLAEQDMTAAREASKKTHDLAIEARNYTDNITKVSSELTRDLKDFLSSDGATPADVRVLANRVLNMTIELKPEQITDLAKEINDTVSQLTNIESVIKETRQDLEYAKNLKIKATTMKDDALSTLKTAKDVIGALDEASTAQNLAEEAIQKANEDIEAAQNDLNPIGSKTDEAQMKANETTEEVERLRIRLGNLQKSILKIENDAQQVKAEAGEVVVKAESAQEQARDLRQKYQAANSSLAERADQSSNSRQRAQELLQRATNLASETQLQLKQLQSMEDLYNSHATALAALENHIDDLNRKVAFYLAEITNKSDGYRSCSS